MWPNHVGIRIDDRGLVCFLVTSEKGAVDLDRKHGELSRVRRSGAIREQAGVLVEKGRGCSDRVVLVPVGLGGVCG